MALAVSQSNAVRILLPMNLGKKYIAGVGKLSVSQLLDDCISKIGAILSNKACV